MKPQKLKWFIRQRRREGCKRKIKKILTYHIGFRSVFTQFGTGRNIPVFPVCECSLLFDYTKRKKHQKGEEGRWFVCWSARIKVVSCDCMISSHSAFACNCVLKVSGSPQRLARQRGVERLSGLHSQIIGWQTVIRCKFLTSESAGASPLPPPSRARIVGKCEGVNYKMGWECGVKKVGCM